MASEVGGGCGRWEVGAWEGAGPGRWTWARGRKIKVAHIFYVKVL